MTKELKLSYSLYIFLTFRGFSLTCRTCDKPLEIGDTTRNAGTASSTRTETMTEKPKLIIPRSDPEPHYELHFDDHVDFVTLDGKLLLRSKVEQYP